MAEFNEATEGLWEVSSAPLTVILKIYGSGDFATMQYVEIEMMHKSGICH